MVFENVDLYYWLEWFEGVGGFDIILPFLLIFAITFAILQKIKLFGDKRKQVDVIIALVVSFFLIIQQNLVEVIQQFLPRVSMVILVVIMFLILLGVFISDYDWKEHMLSLAAIVSFIVVLWALGASLNWDVPFIDLFTEQDVAVLLVICVFILVIWLIVKEPHDSSKEAGNWFKNIGKQIKGSGPR